MTCQLETAPSAENQAKREVIPVSTESGNTYFRVLTDCEEGQSLRELPKAPGDNSPLYPFSEHRTSEGRQLSAPEYARLVSSSLDSFSPDLEQSYQVLLSALSYDPNFPSQFSQNLSEKLQQKQYEQIVVPLVKSMNEIHGIEVSFDPYQSRDGTVEISSPESVSELVRLSRLLSENLDDLELQGINRVVLGSNLLVNGVEAEATKDGDTLILSSYVSTLKPQLFSEFYDFTTGLRDRIAEKHGVTLDIDGYRNEKLNISGSAPTPWQARELILLENALSRYPVGFLSEVSPELTFTEQLKLGDSSIAGFADSEGDNVMKLGPKIVEAAHHEIAHRALFSLDDPQFFIEYEQHVFGDLEDNFYGAGLEYIEDLHNKTLDPEHLERKQGYPSGYGFANVYEHQAMTMERLFVDYDAIMEEAANEPPLQRGIDFLIDTYSSMTSGKLNEQFFADNAADPNRDWDAYWKERENN